MSLASLALPRRLLGPADVDGRDGGGEDAADEAEERSGEDNGMSEVSVDVDSERKNMPCMLTVRRSDGILGMRDWIDAGSAAIRRDDMSSVVWLGGGGEGGEDVAGDGTISLISERDAQR